MRWKISRNGVFLGVVCRLVCGCCDKGTVEIKSHVLLLLVVLGGCSADEHHHPHSFFLAAAVAHAPRRISRQPADVQRGYCLSNRQKERSGFEILYVINLWFGWKRMILNRKIEIA